MQNSSLKHCHLQCGSGSSMPTEQDSRRALSFFFFLFSLFSFLFSLFFFLFSLFSFLFSLFSFLFSLFSFLFSLFSFLFSLFSFLCLCLSSVPKWRKSSLETIFQNDFNGRSQCRRSLIQDHVREQMLESAVQESGAASGACTATGGQEQPAAGITHRVSVDEVFQWCVNHATPCRRRLNLPA